MYILLKQSYKKPTRRIVRQGVRDLNFIHHKICKLSFFVLFNKARLSFGNRNFLFRKLNEQLCYVE